jgi:hypothetical protein
MSHKHNPPRQNVSRGRAPVTKLRVGGKSRRKSSGANAAYNAEALRASGPALGATPGQLIGAGVKLS